MMSGSDEFRRALAQTALQRFAKRTHTPPPPEATVADVLRALLSKGPVGMLPPESIAELLFDAMVLGGLASAKPGASADEAEKVIRSLLDQPEAMAFLSSHAAGLLSGAFEIVLEEAERRGGILAEGVTAGRVIQILSEEGVGAGAVRH